MLVSGRVKFKHFFDFMVSSMAFHGRFQESLSTYDFFRGKGRWKLGCVYPKKKEELSKLMRIS